MIEKITAAEIYANSVERLSDYPNAAARYGTGGLSAATLKGKYDLLAKLAIAKLNLVVDLINADASDTEAIIKSIQTQVPTGLVDGEGNPTYKSLSDVITDFLDGDVAGYLVLTGLTEATLQDELADLEADIDALEASVGASGDTASASGSVYARIAHNASGIATNAAGLTTLDGSKINKTDIVNDLTTGGAAKVASAETVKTLNTAKIPKTDIVDDVVTGGTAKVASAETVKGLNSRLTTEEGNIDTLETSVGATTDTASASGSIYARIKHNYDSTTTNTNTIGDESTSATLLYRIKALETTASNLSDDLDAAEAILESRQQPIAVDSVEYFSEWLQATEGYTVTQDGVALTPSDLLTGTVILIRATTEPDFWWDGGINTAGTVTVNEVEYVSTATVDETVIGGIRELEYNYTEVDAAVAAAEAAQGLAETAQGLAETARDEAKKWADGTGTISSDAQYENNAKYHAEAAAASATTASGHVDTAEAWAVGTEDTEAEQYENNAKYYSEQAAASAATISDAVDDLNDLKVTTADHDRRIDSAEKVISELNPNGESRVAVSGYGALSLPKNAAQGGLTGNVNGNTLTNLVTNGDFSNGTTGWTGLYNTRTVSNNVMTMTGDGAAANMSAKIAIATAPTVGNYYYCRVKLKPNSTCTYIGLAYWNGSADAYYISVTSPVNGTTYEISTIFQRGASNSSPYIFAQYSDATAQNGATLDVSYMMAVDLTSLGLSTLTAAQCDLMTDLYFSGTKSSLVTRIRCTDGTNTSAAYLEPMPLNRVPNGTVDSYRFGTYDSSDLTSWTPPAPKPYSIHVQKIKAHTLISTNISEIATTAVNVDRAVIPTLAGSATYTTNGKMVEILGRRQILYDDRDNVANIDCYYVVAGAIYYIIPKGESLADARTRIAGLVMNYQLAEASYIVTENAVTGNLIGYPSGTIYFEKYLADAGMYSSGINILRQGYPITALESIQKVNADGTLTSLATASATVAEGGLSFTHTGLTDGDIVFFTYSHTAESVNGSNTVNYLDSNFVIADTADGKFYKWKPVITNGEIASWAITEVT